MRNRESDIAYRARQNSLGMRQLSVWVPSDLQAMLVHLGQIARQLPDTATEAAEPAGGANPRMSRRDLLRDVERLLARYQENPGRGGSSSDR